MTVVEDTAAALKGHDAALEAVEARKNELTLSLAEQVDRGLKLNDMNSGIITDLTRDRDRIQSEYDQHMLTAHPVIKPPAPVPETYSTLFGMGGGNTVRNDVDIDRRYYGPFDKTKILNDLTTLEAKGIYCWLSSKMAYSWPEMAKGTGDDWIRDLLKAEIETMKPKVDDADDIDWAIKSFHHEPEGDGDEDDWRITQARIADILESLDPGQKILKLYLTTTGWGQEFNTQRIAQEVDWETNLWPHDSHISGIGYDAPYNKYGFVWENGVKTATMDKAWTDPHVYVDALAKRGVQFDCDVAIGEAAYSDEAFAKDKTWWAKVCDRAIDNPYQRIRAVCYFDTKLNSKRSWYLGAAGTPKRLYVRQTHLDRRGRP